MTILLCALLLAVTTLPVFAQEEDDSAQRAQQAELQKKEEELSKQEKELDRQERDLAKQAEELQTAEEKSSNLQLRQAVLAARSTLVAWRRTLEEFTLNQKLVERGIVSSRDVDTSREAAENAELAYKEALLDLEEARLDILKEAAVISVVEARVYRTDSVRKSVDVTLANISNPGRARIAYRDASKSKIKELLRVPDIRVSLRAGAIIAEPYVETVKRLDLDEKETITFELLQQDLEAVSVDITYFGKTVTEEVFLRKDSELDTPTVSSMNFDQSGQLGTTITYDLVLERLAESEKTYQLAVLNLPPELKTQFKDPEEDATISSVKFAQDSTKKKLALDVIIPEELPQEKLDVPVTFFVLVLDAKSRDALQELKRSKPSEALADEDLKGAGIARERIVFTPKGVGEAELISSDLYREITVGKQVQIKFKVKNTGSVPLRNIRMTTELPADWEVTLEPDVVRALDIGSESTVDISLFPSPDLGVGDYTVRVDAECTFEGQKISIDEKIVRIHVESRANVLGGLFLLLVLGGALVGIAMFLVRLARR